MQRVALAKRCSAEPRSYQAPFSARPRLCSAPGREERPHSASKTRVNALMAPRPGNGRCGSSIQRALAFGTVQREGRHVDLELFAAFADHLVAAGHDARGGG